MDWGRIFDGSFTAAFSGDAMVFALAAVGLNLHFGYTGLVNFGQVAFLAVGAYSVAMGVVTFGLSFWLAVFLGLLVAIVLAAVLGLPTLRLRADYLAITTIAASEILRLVLRAARFRKTTGGAAGIQNFADDFFDLNPFSGRDYGIGFVNYRVGDFWVMCVGWTLVALACLLTWLLIRSPWGRVLKAIREDEDAVRSLGKNVYIYKMQSLALGGMMGAVAGMLFAIDRQSVVPDVFSTAVTFFAFTIVVLGGPARVLGPVFGSMVFWFLFQGSNLVLRQAIAADYIPGGVIAGNEVGIVRQVLVGLGLMALMIFRPQGMFGDKREVAVSVRR
ncbi:MAG: branched-chain amino acid ABC transporter permease [Acidimicrobiales bacterium]